MKRGDKTTQNRTRTWAAAAALLLCVAVSGCLLFFRLMDYTTQEKRLTIPLTRSNRITAVTEVAAKTKLSAAPLAAQLSAPLAVSRSAPSAAAAKTLSAHLQDGDTVWQGETEVELFRLSYRNEAGEVTVHSRDGKKLLAPGTSNLYRFELKNTGDVSLDYTMEIEAYFSAAEHAIPVEFRVTDWQGEYLVGSAETMADVTALNGVRQSGTVAAGNVYPCTLEWAWPYESGNDEYDTMLGDLASEEDLTLTIVIRTVASGSTDPDRPGGAPDTGDTSQVALLAGVMVASLAGVLVLLLLRRRKDDHEED